MRKQTHVARAPLGLRALIGALTPGHHGSVFGAETAANYEGVPLAILREQLASNDSYQDVIFAAADRDFPGSNLGPDGKSCARECPDITAMGGLLVRRRHSVVRAERDQRKGGRAMNAPRDERAEAAVNALQEAALLSGYLRRLMTDQLSELGKLHAALEKARAALQAGKGGAA
jgi:hypothetical protein